MANWIFLQRQQVCDAAYISRILSNPSLLHSLERIEQYLRIEQEPKPTPSGKPPAYWPASGRLEAKGLCAKYSSDGDEVLHDLSFEVKSGERVGVVG